ncbi:MAG TPA: hypothetical protein VH044_19245 [Polyangiaceae bacterium]|nr:hypothetical protein [Polyangiaceae bacterium]
MSASPYREPARVARPVPRRGARRPLKPMFSVALVLTVAGLIHRLFFDRNGRTTQEILADPTPLRPV